MSVGLMGGAAGRSVDAVNIRTIPQAVHFHSKGFVHHGGALLPRLSVYYIANSRGSESC